MLSDNDIRKFGFESGLLLLKGTTITRWKDGIDIDFPVLEVEKFARAVEAKVHEQIGDVELTLDLLDRMFAAYEDGVPCYEGGDAEDGNYIGPAFRLDDETFAAISDLLNRRRPRVQENEPT